MSIRRHNKNHLKKHAGGDAESFEFTSPPEPQNSMQFWVQHPKQHTFVDLTIFADGEMEKKANSSKWRTGYSGRPNLIRQLAPAIKASLSGVAPETVKGSIHALRTWWRLFDYVEVAAEKAGESSFRIDNVLQITRIHYDYACQNGMCRRIFNTFISIADATLKDLGMPRLYWESPANPLVYRYLPPEVETRVLRLALKQAWETVRKQRTLMDHVREINFVPHTEEEINLHKHWLHFSGVQKQCEVQLPTIEQLRGGLNYWHFAKEKKLTLAVMRATMYPTIWDIHTALHMCLAGTGWNLAVLVGLDARSEETFLRNHPHDESRYILIGTKSRGIEKEMYITGLWKTTWGPGPIIRECLKWIAPIRELLQAKLLIEQKQYDVMCQSEADNDELTRQYIEVQRLERGCRSVWLYVTGDGSIGWVETNNCCYCINNKNFTYLGCFINRLNEKRALLGEAPIGVVKASDFRDMFAIYVWRQSGSNILAVMRLLNHANLRTTQRYIDNNILNAERDNTMRAFLEELFNELGKGRLDITILAHRQQFGSVTPQMETHLHDFRVLERSRLGIGCNNPFNPPIAVQPNVDNSRRCGQQRCLLCNQGVILPESLDGVAMRVEELIAIERTISVEVWLTSDFSQELTNGVNTLKLFPVNDVLVARERWAQAIASGLHHVPGFHFIIDTVEVI